jgi:sugar lactone lactonase YvrE
MEQKGKKILLIYLVITLQRVLKWLKYFLFFKSDNMKTLLLNFLIPYTLFYPEGPLVVGNEVWLTQYSRNNIVKISQDERTPHVLWEEEQCGPASLIKTPWGPNFIIACYDKNELVVIDQHGQSIKRFSHPQLKGPNDFAVVDDQTLLVTASGDFDALAPATGRIFLLKNDSLHLLAQDLHYPNGIAFLAATHKVIVSEHLANRLVSFDLDLELGELKHKKSFYNLPRPTKDPYLGPDGLKVRASQNTLLMAHYAGGQIIEVDFNGKLQNSYPLSEKYPTNLAVLPGPQEKIAVTLMKDATTPPYAGAIQMIDLN